MLKCKIFQDNNKQNCDNLKILKNCNLCPMYVPEEIQYKNKSFDRAIRQIVQKLKNDIKNEFS